MSYRVCILEDDPTIRELVGERLSASGLEVVTFESGEKYLGQQAESPVPLSDLYILDVRLTGKITGLDVCRSLRAMSPTLPILFLSALSESSDRIEGLRLGADDYLTKPFEMEELALRVQGMLKRRSWYGSYPRMAPVFCWGPNAVDFENLEGKKGSEQFKMSQKECMVMKLLIEKEGEVVSRDEILDRVWGYNLFPSTRTVDNFVLRLRRYFEQDPARPKFIHSVRGLGYRFTSSETAEGQLESHNVDARRGHS